MRFPGPYIKHGRASRMLNPILPPTDSLSSEADPDWREGWRAKVIVANKRRAKKRRMVQRRIAKPLLWEELFG